MIVLHHNDLDGRAAAAVVRLSLSHQEYTIKFVEMDYNREVPFDDIEPGEEVWIIDFSLQKPGDWDKLLAITRHVTWIDHHKTAIKGDPEGVQHSLPGVRSEDGCGALLTWQYIMPQVSIPFALRIVDDWDRWIHSIEDTIPFKMGIEMGETGPEEEVWSKLFAIDYSQEAALEAVTDCIEAGKIAQKFQSQFYKEYVKSWGFETELEDYSVFAINLGRASSLAFGGLLDEYDLCVSFVFDGNQYTMSLYSNKEHVECGEMCKARGGGGHKGAAGFQSPTLPDFLSRRVK
jgi:oligoribonuclease NrnB/cAMP/cGMP phosphodiesterase (DHH superfamily)